MAIVLLNGPITLKHLENTSTTNLAPHKDADFLKTVIFDCLVSILNFERRCQRSQQ